MLNIKLRRKEKEERSLLWHKGAEVRWGGKYHFGESGRRETLELGPQFFTWFAKSTKHIMKSSYALKYFMYICCYLKQRTQACQHYDRWTLNSHLPTAFPEQRNINKPSISIQLTFTQERWECVAWGRFIAYGFL